MSSEQDNVTVAVESGLHAGVQQDMSPGRVTVGGSVSSDIVLQDAGVAAAHIAVTMEGRRFHLEALANGVDVDEVGVLNAGESCALDLPVVIRLGGATLRWSSAVPDIASPSLVSASFFRRMVPSRTAWISGLAVIIGGGFFVSHPDADAAFRKTDLRPISAGEPADGAEPAPRKLANLPERVAVGSRGPVREKPPIQSDSAIALIEQEIAKAGLLNVSVTPGTGVVTATGSIEPAAAARWQALQQWFDERFAGELTLVNAVAVKAEKLPSSIAIEAVWRGATPYLIVRGQKYAPGSTLDGGWAIERIEAEKVLLKRDGRIVAVRY